MTDGPEWGPTLDAIKRPPGGSSKNRQIPLDEIANWQDFQRERTGADIAVAFGGVDIGNLFDGWGFVNNWVGGVIGRFRSFFNGWFNRSDGTGSEAEVTYVIENIKDTIINGYTVTTFTSNTAAWPVPAHTECIAIMVGGGQPGSGVNGGLHGSFVASPIELTGITALDIQVGTAGNLSYIRVADSAAHSGTILAQSPVHGSKGGIATTFGLTETSSQPGSGGQAGTSGTSSGSPSAGLPGESSALAAGGAGGGRSTTGPGHDGQPGASVSAGSQIKCGGGGGGGGGGTSALVARGGDGGAGGYPGGGGGGRAIGWSGGSSGSVGPGAPGVVWLYYK